MRIEPAPFDLVISGVRLSGRDGLVDLGIADGRIAAIEPMLRSSGPRHEAGGALACGGFVESHIHLDKAGILARCPICDGTLAEAVALTARAKAAFTVADVYQRASALVEKAILHGTTRMRTFVEVDPRAGFRSLEALLAVKADYAFALDLELCAFAQEGLTNEPETIGMLGEALRRGADLVGGCPYTDPDPVAHVAAIFDVARDADVAVDFHADFDLDPARSILPEIVAQTRRRNYQGRISVGHVTKLSAMAPADVDAIGVMLAEAQIAVTVLPATDLFLMGRSADRLVPRGLAPAERLRRLGVLTTIATNNVLNPFTPMGDGSLGRMANLYANIAQLAREDEFAAAFEAVTANPARLLGAEYGIAVGRSADIVLIDAVDPASAVRESAPALAGWKRGVQTFVRERARLLWPAAAAERTAITAGET